MSNHTNNWR